MAKKEAQTDRRGRRYIEDEQPANPQFIAAAQRVKWIRYITLLILVALILFALVAYSQDFNVTNIRYLLSYLDVTPVSSVKIQDKITFGQDSTNREAVYKNGLALVNRDGLSVYSITGSVVFTDRVALSNPQITANDKYIIAYDLGGTKVLAYNSLSRLFEYDTDGNGVYAVSAAKNGSFAVATAQSGYRAVVLVFDENLQKIFTWTSRDKLVTSVDLSPDGRRVLIACTQSVDGDYSSDISCYQTAGSDTDALWTVKQTGALPLSVKWQDYGAAGYAVVYDDRVVTYKADQTVGTYKYPSSKLKFFTVSGKDIAVAVQDPQLGYGTHIYVIDGGGKVLWDAQLRMEIRDMALTDSGGTLYYLQQDVLHAVELGADGGSAADTVYRLSDYDTGEYITIISCDDAQALLASGSSTLTVKKSSQPLQQTTGPQPQTTFAPEQAAT